MLLKPHISDYEYKKRGFKKAWVIIYKDTREEFYEHPKKWGVKKILQPMLDDGITEMIIVPKWVTEEYYQGMMLEHRLLDHLLGLRR